MNTKIKQTLELAKNLIAHHANGGDWEAQQSQRVIEAINECLAEPVRNCDLYATPKEAGEAFISESCENPCGNCTVSDECHNPLIHECGINWLFAEAKGETK